MTRKVLLVCGIVASLLYVAMDRIAAMLYQGYSSFSQAPSELSAIGAPTADLWFWLGIPYTFLTIAFGWGVWKSAGQNRPLRIVAGLILFSGFLGFIWPFGPMHQREVLAAGGGTFSDTLHLILSGVTVPLFLLTTGFGAAAFEKRFRVYSIATMVIGFVFGALTGMQAPKLQANLPTPWMGLWERINIAVYMLWIVVLAIKLLRSGETAVRHEIGGGTDVGAPAVGAAEVAR
jgi:hypothetical protein